MAIKVWVDSKFIGFISRIYYTKGSYSITKDYAKAKKGYKNMDQIQYDIDFCMKHSPSGYLFTT